MDIGLLINEIRTFIDDSEDEELTTQLYNQDNIEWAKSFYNHIVEISLFCNDDDANKQLKLLAIWPAGNELSTLTNVMLPGNFKDPIGIGKLLKKSYFSYKVVKFLQDKLLIKNQTIDEYVKTAIPIFFEAGEPDDEIKFKALLKLLSQQEEVLDNSDLVNVIQENVRLPNCLGEWTEISSLYLRSEELVKILGDDQKLWVDETKIPTDRAVINFLYGVGLLEKPIPKHLVARIINISKASRPDNKAVKTIKEAFCELSVLYENTKKHIHIESQMDTLLNSNCLPVKGDNEVWYPPDEIYAPFRYQAFESQANIFDCISLGKI